MDGVTVLEPDESEFVEVDPTGRYGRVCALFSFPSIISLFLFILLSPVL